MSDFRRCLAATLRWEGGYSDHPDDPGGATMKGIIQRVYDRYRNARGLAAQHVRNITDGEVEEIYFKYYWAPLQCDEMPPGVDLAVFDFGVNSGINRSAKYLQRVLEVKIDGQVGPDTLGAIRRYSPRDIVDDLMDDRLKFVHRIPHKAAFIKGWENRISDIRSVSTGMADTYLQSIGQPASTPQALPPKPATQQSVPVTPEAAAKAETSANSPKRSMLRSKTGLAAAATAVASGITIFEQVGSTANHVATTVKNVGASTDAVSRGLTSISTAIQNPFVLLAIFVLFASLWFWNERKRKMEDLES